MTRIWRNIELVQHITTQLKKEAAPRGRSYYWERYVCLVYAARIENFVRNQKGIEL